MKGWIQTGADLCVRGWTKAGKSQRWKTSRCKYAWRDEYRLGLTCAWEDEQRLENHRDETKRDHWRKQTAGRYQQSLKAGMTAAFIWMQVTGWRGQPARLLELVLLRDCIVTWKVHANCSCIYTHQLVSTGIDEWKRSNCCTRGPMNGKRPL